MKLTWELLISEFAHWTIHPGHRCWWNHKSDQSQGVPSRPLLLRSFSDYFTLQAVYYAVTTSHSEVPSCTRIGLRELPRLPNKDWVLSMGVQHWVSPHSPLTDQIKTTSFHLKEREVIKMPEGGTPISGSKSQLFLSPDMPSWASPDFAYETLVAASVKAEGLATQWPLKSLLSYMGGPRKNSPCIGTEVSGFLWKGM